MDGVSGWGQGGGGQWGAGQRLGSQGARGEDEATRNLRLALMVGRAGVSGLSLLNAFLRSPQLPAFSQGLGGLLSGAQAGGQFAQGQYGPGTLSLLQALSRGTGAINQAYPGLLGAYGGLAASGLGVGAGLAGTAYGLSQGQTTPGQAFLSLLQTAPSLANLAPAGWTVGGIPISAQTGAQTGALASEGLGTGAGAAGGSLATGLGFIGIAPASAFLAKTIYDLFTGGFAGPKLPEVGGVKAHSMGELRSLSAAQGLQPRTQQLIRSTRSPAQLLQIAQGGGELAPSGEILFHHDQWGTRDTPGFTEKLQALAQSGNPQDWRDFIKGIRVYTGQTGGATPNYVLTDTYRRQLAASLGLQDVQGLFEAEPSVYRNVEGYEQLGGSFSDRFQRQLAGYEPWGGSRMDQRGFEAMMAAIPTYASPTFGDFGGLSPLYRDPSLGRLKPEDVGYFQNYLSQVWQRYQRANEMARMMQSGSQE